MFPLHQRHLDQQGIGTPPGGADAPGWNSGIIPPETFPNRIPDGRHVPLPLQRSTGNGDRVTVR